LNHEGTKSTKLNGGEAVEALAASVVDAGLKVHRTLGPGLLESAYEHCIAHELSRRGFSVARQIGVPLSYEGLMLDVGYRMDLVIENAIVLEIKAVDVLCRFTPPSF